MNQNIAVLTLTPLETIRSGNVITKGPRLESFSTERPVPFEATVEIHQNVSPAELTDINRDPKRTGAPLMPLRLIEPRESGGDGAGNRPASVDNITWGVRAVKANKSNASGKDITVAVLDTGIEKEHPAFRGITNWVTKDFTKGPGSVEDNSGNEPVDDQNGHGTHCAGTIFGHDVNGLRIGVAPGITRAIIGKVLGGAHSGGSGDLAKAMQWAANHGADIISMSLGIDFPGYVKALVDDGMDARPATSMALEAYRANILMFEKLTAFFVAQAAFTKSVLIVSATGNESDRYRARSPYTINLSPPAAAPGIMGIGALAQDGDRYKVAGFSNTGAVVAAPGVDIISAWPGRQLKSLDGTSMATPHVAGVAALWAEELRKTGSLNADTLRAKIIATATVEPINPVWHVEDVGSGLVQAP